MENLVNILSGENHSSQELGVLVKGMNPPRQQLCNEVGSSVISYYAGKANVYWRSLVLSLFQICSNPEKEPVWDWIVW